MNLQAKTAAKTALETAYAAPQLVELGSVQSITRGVGDEATTDVANVSAAAP